MRRWRQWTDTPLLILTIGSIPLLLIEIERDVLTIADSPAPDVVNIPVLVAFAADYLVDLTLS